MAHITITRDGNYQYINITDSLFFGAHAPGGLHGGDGGYSGGYGGQGQDKKRKPIVFSLTPNEEEGILIDYRTPDNTTISVIYTVGTEDDHLRCSNSSIKKK